ncbi:MAG: ATPase [Candidatus Leucobacter sulfamidivorax]|nr:ATPase [Candidatus Leucobacter sulfamidivorax]
MSTDTTAAWPRVAAVIKDDGSGEVNISGKTHPVQAEDLPGARAAVVELVAETADKLGRSVRATMTDPDGDWPVIIAADGTVEADDSAPARPRERDAEDDEPASAEDPAIATDTPAAAAVVPSPGHAEVPAIATATSTSATRREARQSFLTQEQTEEPATRGWRGALSRVGLRMSPSDAERAERADVHEVSQHWPGPRTIAIVNAKGGAGKTPSTVLLAAVFARYGGAGVLTWDNNQTRGTLGWRTEQGPHEATLLDLLPQTDRLLSTGAQSADLAHFVHHQTRDRYDVLRSKPMELASAQRVDAADVDAIHQVASKYYRLIFIDSGNDESDPMWRRMIDHTDQLVVATTTRDDHAEAGALLLEALAERDEHTAQLTKNAVVVVNQADPKANNAARVADGYRAIARDAITIPHDPAMIDGVLRYGSLRPATQRAWLAAGAAVARGL